ncbi:MAG: two-component system osmolarity sensor histidine kinase EnvZ [Pseudorhodobacter sp.]|jgi:two-component system osmolarity sensor histidine kinase EnvZ
MFNRLKYLLPRGLYGRAALILIVPIVTIQLVVSVAFIQRYFERVTHQLTGSTVIEINYLLERVASAPDLETAQAVVARLASGLDLQARLPAPLDEATDYRQWQDLTGGEVIFVLRRDVPDVLFVELRANLGLARLWVNSAKGPVLFLIDRGRLSASNPHQLLVLMIATSVLMTIVAYYFLRNQLRPITLLADAAAAFGKGQNVAYRPRGAQEVRAAGNAFLDMRGRIEKQIEQRTLMLSGISHDLRSPLTRLRLGLSMLPEAEETEDLLRDVADMQRLVDEFLSFARGDAMEQSESVDPQDLARRIVENAQRTGQAVVLKLAEGQGMAVMRPSAITRALENLIGNAVRYGKNAEVSVIVTPRLVRFVVEDDGPGIAIARRDEALHPFTRLDAARDPNRGGGVGLGLSIAVDIARSHGGTLRLGESPSLGGLQAELIIAR